MRIGNIIRKRHLSVAGAAAAALSMAAVGTAGAAPYDLTGASQSAPGASASIVSKPLTVTGTKGSDSISMTPAGDDVTKLVVDLGNGQAPQRFDREAFSAIAVSLLGGDDQFSSSNGMADKQLVVDGGRGNDTIATGDGNDLIFGGPGDDFIDGNRGNDTAFLDSGRDTFHWDPGDGSDFVDGADGVDTLAFNGSNAPET